MTLETRPRERSREDHTSFLALEETLQQLSERISHLEIELETAVDARTQQALEGRLQRLRTKVMDHRTELEGMRQHLFDVEEQELLAQAAQQQTQLRGEIDKRERSLTQLSQDHSLGTRRQRAQALLDLLQEPADERELLGRQEQQQRVARYAIPLVVGGVGVVFFSSFFLALFLTSRLTVEGTFFLGGVSLLLELSVFLIAGPFMRDGIVFWGLDREKVISAHAAKTLREKRRQEIQQYLARDAGSPEEEEQFWAQVAAWGLPLEPSLPAAPSDQLEQRFEELEARPATDERIGTTVITIPREALHVRLISRPGQPLVSTRAIAEREASPGRRPAENLKTTKLGHAMDRGSSPRYTLEEEPPPPLRPNQEHCEKTDVQRS